MPAAVDRVIFSTECVTIGAFRCAPDDPSFRNSGAIQNDCFVFPRTAVVIQHEHARPFVADPTLITLYNRHQLYERHAVSPDGDRCDWFAVSPDVLRGALVNRDPAAADAERPIRFAHAPSDASTYLAQRRVFVEACESRHTEPLEVEERVVALLDRVLTLAYGARTPVTHVRRSRAADLAEAAKRWVAPRAAKRLTLKQIAAGLDVSVFHLCRTFHRATGLTLHRYRDEIRLRLALERLEQGDRDLISLAFDLGYSSHSHFSAAFHRQFGVPPSQARKFLIARG